MKIHLERLVGGLACSLLLTLAGMAAVSAVVLPDDITEKLAQLKDSYLLADGFTRIQDIESLTEDHWYTNERFPEWNTESVFLPDSAMTPVQKAVMLVEHIETSLPHVRYLVRFRSEFVFNDGYSASPRAHVSVTRLNLGPDYRKDLVAEVGEAHLASPREFGVGPHVSWRFVFSTIQGQNAHLEGASRKEVADNEAALMTCLDIPCLSLDLPEGPLDGMEEVDAPEYDIQAHDADAVPAYNSRMGHIAGLLAATALGDNGYGEPVEGLAPGQSPVQIVLSAGVGGQDPADAGIMHQTHVMDDAIAELWHARVQWGSHISWMRHIVYRPGRH